MTPEEVVEALVQSPAGQIVACNVYYGISEGLIERDLARDVLGWVGRLNAHTGRSNPSDLVGAVGAVRDRCYPDDLRCGADPPDFRARGCRAPPEEGTHGEMSCVVAASTLRELIHPTDVARLRAEGLVFPATDSGPMVSEIVNQWRRRPSADRRVRFNPAASLGRPGEVVWFTRRDCLAQAQASATTSLAQRTRDALGLVHQSQGIVLGALHIPAEGLRAVGLSRPTFVDAGSHSRFKTWPDGEEARRDLSWGFTTDLSKVVMSEPCVDGCVERVAGSIDGSRLADVNGLEVEVLGAVTTSTNTGPEADRAFANRLRGTLTPQGLACKLRRLLGQSEHRLAGGTQDDQI